ncbi:FkbM family methyltransferase [Selenomonas sp.]|uniref:FkbM family methyltransferase n=1 Tax=Selenomonas sp. TaxID=2053611 RepID=UPI0025EADCFE|nr:FkbM family methyltransferase [Selenomonas sp.]MCI6284977.1 FkbM family methyltransferase [Selenomonas sp.]
MKYKITNTHEVTSRIDELEQKIDDLNRKMEALDAVHQKLDAISQRLDGIDALKQKLDAIEAVQARNADVQAIVLDVRGYVDRSEVELHRFENMWISDVMDRIYGIEESPLYQYIHDVHEAIPLMDIAPDDGHALVRIGKESDGGYVMLDDFAGRKIAYSFGICDDVSWDKEMAKRGMDVYMYDHTIDGLPEDDERFHWQKIGITGTYDEQTPQLKTLDMLLHENGHDDTYGMILKIDVEGAEWGVLETVSEETLKHFSQIVIEFHDMTHEPLDQGKLRSLQKIGACWQLVHVHGNNCMHSIMSHGIVLPDVMECTFVRKDEHTFASHEGWLPGALDQANKRGWPDILIGKWS